jgi:hypothetical protein
MTALTRELDAALNAMERSFHVRLIGTFDDDLEWAPADVEAAPWLETYFPDFDQFPVRLGDRTVGILVRSGEQAGRIVSEVMEPLREGLIVSADMPIANLISELKDNHYRLILRGGRIDGLVTQSDLLKLPVRILVFGLITHLEQVMADIVSVRWPDDSWFPKLTESRQSKIIEKEAELRRRGMNPPKIELTEFSDKRNLCKELVNDGKSKFKEELEKLRELRDQLAHASTFVDRSDGKTGVVAFVEKFESATRWIDELTRLAANLKDTE